MKPGQVQVWYALLDRGQVEIAEFERILSLEEMERAYRFRRSVDREHYVVRRGLLRRFLSQYLRCNPNKIDILRESNGKPYLAAFMNPDNIQFSEADSDSMAAFAFARSSRVGVDIEKVREFPDMLELVEHQFTEREYRAVLSCAEDQRLALFYRLWTRKEAVLKAQGEGLLKGLDSVDVAGDEGPGPWRARFSDKAIAQEFVVADIEAPPGFCAAVAAAGAIDDILVRSHDR